MPTKLAASNIIYTILIELRFKLQAGRQMSTNSNSVSTTCWYFVYFGGFSDLSIQCLPV